MLQKSAFLGKLCHLKHQGKKQEMMSKVEQWIESNLDELYERRGAGAILARQDTKTKAEVMRSITVRSGQLEKAPSMTNA